MKVLKKQKVSKMKTTTAVLNPTSQHIPPDVVSASRTPYRSIIGLILEFKREQITNPPKSTLARVVSQPRIEPRTFRVCQSHDEKVYSHYAAYCETIGVEPRTIERWDSLRDSQQPTTHKTVNENTEQDSFFATFLSGDRKLTLNRPQHFSAMMSVDVGVRDTSSCDPDKSFTPKPVHRIVTVVEAEASYYSPSQQLLELRGATLYPITPRCEQEPACWTRPMERPITFDTHLSRSAYLPSLQEVNKIELTPFEYRNRRKITSIVNRKRKFKDPVANHSLRKPVV